MSCNNRRTILKGKETGQWLLVLPSPVIGMELSAQESYVTLYFSGMPNAHRICQSSVTAASRSSAFAMRLTASAVVS
jgi:hypothetical protein